MIRIFKPLLASGLAALMIAGAAANESMPQQPLTTEQADDSIITENVKAAMAADATLSGAEINIETLQGEVHLSGYVGNPDDIQKATDLARGIAGVKAVKNELKAK